MTTSQDTVHAQGRSTYDIYIEIDIDCQELLEAVDMKYTLCRDDNTQNEIALHLDKGEYDQLVQECNFHYTDEQQIGATLLNEELGEYVTKVTIYKPNGNTISFC